MKRILLSPDPVEGGTPAPPAPPAPPGESQPPPPAPPPAAATVLSGDRTEREVQLQEEIKKREIRISVLEDENHRLKSPPTPAPKTEPEEDDSWAPIIR